MYNYVADYKYKIYLVAFSSYYFVSNPLKKRILKPLMGEVPSSTTLTSKGKALEVRLTLEFFFFKRPEMVDAFHLLSFMMKMMPISTRTHVPRMTFHLSESLLPNSFITSRILNRIIRFTY